MARDFPNDNNARLANLTNLPLAGALTVAATVQLDTVPGGSYSSSIFTKTTAGSTSIFNLEAYAGNFSQYVTARACQVAVLGAPAIARIVAIFAGSSSRLWRDAVGTSTGGDPGSIADQSAPLQMGGRADYSSPVDGRMCEIAMWEASLVTLEIGAYLAGISPLVIRPTKLKVYWPLWGQSMPEIDLGPSRLHLSAPGGVTPPQSRHLNGSPMAL